MITAAMIDQREPEWVRHLAFGGVPVMVTLLETGDLMAATDDGETILIERKTPDDFLNSLRDDRLFQQLSTMLTETRWCYLVITDQFQRGPENRVITARGVTGWQWASVQGALLTVQELGIFTIFGSGDASFEGIVIHLSQRSHEQVLKIPPAKMPRILSIQEQILASLPGIGLERAGKVLDVAGSPAWALCALTDATTYIDGIGASTKKRVRAALGLQDDMQLCVDIQDGQEVLIQGPLGGQ